MNSIYEADLKGKRVFLRADFNVPLEGGRVVDTNRIEAVLPTIKFLIEKSAKIIIGSHLGRPEGRKSEETSLIPVVQQLSNMLDRKVIVTNEIVGEKVKQRINEMSGGDILFLGNLRWDSREEANDEQFARQLADLAEIYINDAFAVSHRANASVEAITKFLPSYAGILLSQEITNLELFINNPAKPFVLIIGGAKTKDKAEVIRELGEIADSVLVGGAVANTFLKANGKDISRSLHDEDMIGECSEILAHFGAKIILPSDWESREKDGGFEILDIGPETINNFTRIINGAASVFWNGNLGYTEEVKFASGSKAVAESIAKNSGTKILAGGDTVGFVNSQGLDKGFTFISTGGGAALEFLAGKKLPGIEALDKINLRSVL